MNSNGNQQGGSPLYQYAIPGALFLIGSVTLTYYFRQRHIASTAIQRRLELEDDFPFATQALERRKPLVFDAYLSESPEAPREPWSWDVALPFSVLATSFSASQPAKSSLDRRHHDPRPNGAEPVIKGDPTRVIIGMIILMPAPSPIPLPIPDDERPPPALELGLLETEVVNCLPDVT
ncbi:hypothetical protein MKEN_01052500 [Mycena kentingensis (nom. inval.)]|nr:hypothetical protein MKEN_01052500 [Mycena kentingensis (nom. inval.)]